MTVVAIRDNIIAADRMASISGTALSVPKLFTIHDGALVPVRGGAEALLVVSISGDYSLGMLRAHWYADGDAESVYPKPVDTQWCRIVIAVHGKVSVYEDYPVPVSYHDEYLAFGSGMDYAMGAMYCGANAIEAVAAACAHDTSCGKGIDHVTLAPYPTSTFEADDGRDYR